MRTADLVNSHQKITQLNESLLIKTIDTEERERRRFSEDLHDGLGPLLSTIRIHLELIQARQNQQSEQNALIRTANDLLDDAISSTRDIANNLTTNILRDFGIQEALKGYIEKINSIGALQIHLLTDNPIERYPSHVELALYRICLELINNSLKHAKANTVKIVISGDERYLNFNYYENGILRFMIFSLGNKPIPAGELELIRFTGEASLFNRTRALAGNLIAQEVPVVTHEDIITGFEDTTDFAFSAYPNPASDKLWVEFNTQAETAELTLLNIHGQAGQLKEINHSGHHRLVFDLDGLPSGI
jgi:two-component sensor histidine kinase